MFMVLLASWIKPSPDQPVRHVANRRTSSLKEHGTSLALLLSAGREIKLVGLPNNLSFLTANDHGDTTVDQRSGMTLGRSRIITNKFIHPCSSRTIEPSSGSRLSC